MKGRWLILMVLLWCCLAVSPAFAQVTSTNTVGSNSENISQANSTNQNGASASVNGYFITESGQGLTKVLQNQQNEPFFPLPVPLIQGGRVGDVTDQLPNFAGMKKLKLPFIKENGERKEVDPGETVNPSKIKHFYGKMFCRISLQDLWEEIVSDFTKCQKDGWDPAKMRYRIYYKDRASGRSMNFGGSAGASGITSNTAVQGSGGGIFGWSSSTADPHYIVMICEVVQ
jgi:hypothetical protein